LAVWLSLILRRRAAPLPLWGGPAAGGAAYFLAYLYLRLFSQYFLAPADLIALLCTGRLAILSWEKNYLWRRYSLDTHRLAAKCSSFCCKYI
jgi:hypothetical protein